MTLIKEAFLFVPFLVLEVVKMSAEEKITKEEISEVGFAIVAYSGDARSDLVMAMNKTSEGKISEAKALVKDAE